MDIAATLKWIEATALATSIRDSLFLFPMLESIHVIGLALVFGMIFVLDLRMLGLASSMPAAPRVTPRLAPRAPLHSPSRWRAPTSRRTG